VWIERVDESGSVGVVIEDGQVVEAGAVAERVMDLGDDPDGDCEGADYVPFASEVVS